MRMVLDEFAMKNLRRAVEITRKGLMEGMKLARPGLTTLQVMETVDYVYRLNGAGLGFHTGVALASQLNEVLRWESTREEEAARKGDARIDQGVLPATSYRITALKSGYNASQATITTGASPTNVWALAATSTRKKLLWV